MPLTKKGFEMVAKALHGEKPVGDNLSVTEMTRQWKRDVKAIASALIDENPRFDYWQFVQQCGLEEEPR